MRRFLLFTNALVAVIFTVVFVLTFMLGAQIEQSARAMLMQQGEAGLTATVNQAEAVLQSGVVKSLLKADQERAFQAEIDEFRDRPEVVMNRILTQAHKAQESERAKSLAAQVSPRLKARLDSALDKLTGWKSVVAARYEEALAQLLRDVRIFACTNIIAALLAFLMAWAARWDGSPHLVFLSLLLLLSTAAVFAVYIDGFSLWSFMWKSSIEWWYPAYITVVYLHLWFQFPPPKDVPFEPARKRVEPPRNRA